MCDWIMDQADSIEVMSDQEAGQLLKAVCCHLRGSAGGNPCRTVAVVLAAVKKKIDAEVLKKEMIRQKRVSAGALGGLAKNSKCKQMLANASECYDLPRNNHPLSTPISTSPEFPPKGGNSAPKGAKKQVLTFKKPTVEEVKAYCAERKNFIDAGTFVDFYESKGWRIGQTQMKDWRAAVRTWERKDGNNNQNGKGKSSYAEVF